VHPKAFASTRGDLYIAPHRVAQAATCKSALDRKHRDVENFTVFITNK
jgi:hypothetical protein